MIYKIILVLAVFAKLSTLTDQQTTTATVTVQNQGNATCTENEEMCLDDLGLLICVPICDILEVEVTFKVNADYGSFPSFIKLGFDVLFKAFLSGTLGVPIDAVKNLKHYDGSIGVNATIDYSQTLVENLDDLRNVIQNDGEIGLGFVKYPFISDSFRATVIRGDSVPSAVTATIWLPNTTLVSDPTNTPVPTGSTICNETEVSCLDDFGYSICVPLELCEVFSVILSFTIDANYNLFRFVIRLLVDIFRYFLAELLDIDLDEILGVEILEGSIIVNTEVRESEKLNDMLEELRERFNSGNATVNLMGANYSIKPNSFNVTVKKNDMNITSSGLVNATIGILTCLGNEQTCLDDTGLAICVPESLCDILDIIVSFKINAIFDVLKPLFETLYGVVKELVARFLNVDTNTVLNIKFFNGSLGVNATLSPDAAGHIEELRQEILSGGQVELLGVKYDVMPDSFSITVNKGTTNTSESNNMTTDSPVVSFTAASDNLTCLQNEETCLDSAGYEICVPKSFCEIIEIVVTFKINAVFKLLAPVLSFLNDVMKDIVATFLNVDTSNIYDIKFFEGSLGINATLSADTASHIDTMRKEMDSGSQVTLMGVNYDIIPNSFHVNVKSASPTASPQNYSSYDLTSYKYANVTMSHSDYNNSLSSVRKLNLSTTINFETTTQIIISQDSHHTDGQPGLTNDGTAIMVNKESTIPLTTDLIMEITTSSVKENISETSHSLSSNVKDVTTALSEDKNASTPIKVSTRQAEDTTAKDMHTSMKFSTHSAEEVTTSNHEDSEQTTAMKETTNVVEGNTTSRIQDEGLLTSIKVTTNVAKEITTSNAEDKDMLSTLMVTTNVGDKTTTANLDDDEISTKAAEDTTTDSLEYVEMSTAIEVETTATARAEDKVMSTTMKVSTQALEDTTIATKVSTKVDEKTTVTELKETTASKEVSTSQSTEPEGEMSTESSSDKDTTTSLGTTVGRSEASTSNGTPVNLPVTTETYKIQTVRHNDTTAGANILGGNLTVFFLVTVITSLM